MTERVKIKFAKTHPNAKIPSKRDEDGGYDIYACFDEDYIVIPPHTTVMIPSGIASSFESGYVIQLNERGSTGTKSMGQRCGVIDSGYRDAWMIPITNHNERDIVILKNDKYFELPQKAHTDSIIYPYEKAISQALLLPVPLTEIEEISYDELKMIPSERGTGRLGSSGK